jgi:hypothetical protein
MRPIAVTLPHQPLTLIPAGCLHWPIGDKQLLKAWIERVKKDPRARTILMGDTLDAARTHYRDHLKTYRGDGNSQLALDEWHKRDVEELARLLKPIRDKILAAILGNHYWTYADETNSEQYLCQLLKIPYLGPLGIVRLDFQEPSVKSRQTRNQVTIFAHHHGGSAGGRTLGGDVNSLTKQETTFNADVYLLGHTHRRYGIPETSIGITSRGEPRVEAYDKIFVRTGAFYKCFVEDKPSVERAHIPTYAELKALRPTNLGWVELTIRFRWIKQENSTGTTTKLPKPVYDLRIPGSPGE